MYEAWPIIVIVLTKNCKPEKEVLNMQSMQLNSNDLDELSQWLCYDDSTINIGNGLLLPTTTDKGICQLNANLHDKRQSKIHDQLKMSQVDGVTLSGAF